MTTANITTKCNPLDWMLGKATVYTKNDAHVTYQFRGNVPARMRHEIIDWMKAQNARYNDGRTRSGYVLTLEEVIDVERRWYRFVSLSVSSGCYHSTANNVEVLLTIYDCPLTNEDLAEMRQAA